MTSSTIVTLHPFHGTSEHSWRGADKVIEYEKNAHIRFGCDGCLPERTVTEPPDCLSDECEPMPGETPSPFSPTQHDEELEGPRLELRWDMKRKSRLGVFVGAAESLCDVVIPDHRGCFKGVSSVQGLFSFDSQNRLTYRDVRSPDRLGEGTSISFDGQARDELRRGFTWILSGTDYLDQVRPEIILRLHKRLHFRVDVTDYIWSRSEYVRAVDGFMKQTGNADEGSSLTLGMFSLEDKNVTALVTEARTYPRHPVYIENGALGSGSFGTVTCLYDVTVGICFARKQPRKDARALTSRVKREWENEIRLLKRIDEAATETSETRIFSQHVVRIVNGAVDPVPFIDLEYVPLGSLHDVHHNRNLTRDETISVFDQMLQALTFLHGLDPPVAHRDIKPSNILVQNRNGSLAPYNTNKPWGIVVKLADFGLSKDETLRTVEIGTRRYMAPELSDEIDKTGPGSRGPAYSTAVDIWALGVSIYELAYPCHFPNQAGFSEYVRSTVTLTPGDIAELIADHMVILNPKYRSTARNILVYLRHGPINSSPKTKFLPVAQTPPLVSSTDGSSRASSGSSYQSQRDDRTPDHKRADCGLLPQLRPVGQAPTPAGSPSGSSRNSDGSPSETTNANRTVRPCQSRQFPQPYQTPPATRHAYDTRSRYSLASASPVPGSSQQSSRYSQFDTPPPPPPPTVRRVSPSTSNLESNQSRRERQPNLELSVRETSGSGLQIRVGFDDSRSQFSESTDSRGSSLQQQQLSQQSHYVEQTQKVQQPVLTNEEILALQYLTSRRRHQQMDSLDDQQQRQFRHEDESRK